MAVKTISFDIKSVNLNDIISLSIGRSGNSVILKASYDLKKADGSVFKRKLISVPLNSSDINTLKGFIINKVLPTINTVEGF